MILGVLTFETARTVGFVVVYSAAIGVAIDVDHFLISRLNRGNWDAAKACLADPVASLLDQEDIFTEDEVKPAERILSHLLIITLVVPPTWVLAPDLALVTGVVLYLHLLTDAVADAFDLYET